VSCLRSDQLAVKNVRLPRMSEAELDKAVLWECQECFGFPVAPDRLHYLNAGEVRQGTDSRDEIILLAVAEETLREHLQTLAELRLRPEHVDAEPMALFRAFRRLLRRAGDENTVSVIVDVGLASTRVVIARGTTVLLIKNLDVGGRRFNESVARELGLSYAEAAYTRRRCGQPETHSNAPEASSQVARSVVDAIRGQVEALAREIALCLRYCSVTFRGLRAEEITLTGGEAYDPALVQLLAEHLGCRCVVGAPLRGVELEQADMGSDRRGVLTEWSVAAGLALRGLPGEPGGGNGNHAGTGLSA
jgi:type IV pilus assembly protein PilM